MRDDLIRTLGKEFVKHLGQAWDSMPKPVGISTAQGMIEDAIGAALRAAHTHHRKMWTELVDEAKQEIRDELRLNGWDFLAELDRRDEEKRRP